LLLADFFLVSSSTTLNMEMKFPPKHRLNLDGEHAVVSQKT
jgi:hypothetical protein